jgi:uncharacterized membrane protein YkoI
MLKKITYRLLLIMVLQCAVANDVYAFDYGSAQSQEFRTPYSTNASQFGTIDYVQNGADNLRSRSDVMQEVKRRYNAEILKISLDERQQVYRVRVLMPNGKVRNLTISARR